MEDAVKFRILQEAERLLEAAPLFLAEFDVHYPGDARDKAVKLLEAGPRFDLGDYIRAGELVELSIRLGYAFCRCDADQGVSRAISFSREAGPGLDIGSQRLLSFLADGLAESVFKDNVPKSLIPLMVLAMTIGYAMGKQEK